MTGLGVRSTGPARDSGVEAVQQLAEDDPALQPGQRGPEAEVRPEAEAHVRIGMAVDPQLAGVGPEHLLVPVGRGVDQEHRIARRHRDAADGGGGRRRPHERDHRRRPAQQLLDGAREQRTIGPQAPPTALDSRPAPPTRPRSGSASSRSPPPAAGSGTSPAPPRSAPPPPPLSGSDPTVASTDTRSSAGARRRSSATPIRYSHISTCSAARSSSDRSDSPGITASDQSKKRGHCDPSTPSSSQITCSGNGMERSCTTSNATPPWICAVSAVAFAPRPPPSAAPSTA